MDKNGYRLADWGKSMYGGYYANIYVGEATKHGFITNEIMGIGADTYKGICEILAGYGLKAERTCRRDNI